MSCFDDIVAKSLWGSSEVGWSVSHSKGASGGMDILWKKHSVIVNHSCIGKGFLGINVSWNGGIYNLFNVYAPNGAMERRMLWSSLITRKQCSGIEEWCLGGDFNEFCCREERRG